jgi:hypothetical protein
MDNVQGWPTRELSWVIDHLKLIKIQFRLLSLQLIVVIDQLKNIAVSILVITRDVDKVY